MLARRGISPGQLVLGLALYVVLYAGMIAATLVTVPHASRPQQRLAADYLTEKATELGLDRDRIAAWVANDVALDATGGTVMRGPLGTLLHGAGSSADRALLLHALLDRANIRNQLVYGTTWGVISGDRYLGPNATQDADAQPSDIPDGEFDRITIDGFVDGEMDVSLELRTADLALTDVTVGYELHASHVITVISSAGKSVFGTHDVRRAQSQELAINVQGGTEEYGVSRRLLSGHQTVNVANRYRLIISTGWIPAEVAQREIVSTRSWSNSVDATTRTIGYAFLGLSDANSLQLLKENHLTEHFTEARATIIGAEFSGDSAVPAYSIDLRHNHVDIFGSDQHRMAFSMLHSLYDAGLESQVLSDVTGRISVSGFDVFRTFLNANLQTLGQRRAILSEALTRLASDQTDDGSALTVWPDGRADYWIRFTRQGPEVQAEVALTIKKALTESGLGADWLLTHPTFVGNDSANAATETELALLESAHVPLDYKAAYSFKGALPKQWYGGASRILTYDDKGNLSYEVKFTKLGDAVELYLRSHWDDATNTYLSVPYESHIVINSNDMEHSRVFTRTFVLDSDLSTGRLVLMFSRDMYRELTTVGSTEYQFASQLPESDKPGSGGLSPPIRLFVVSRPTLMLQFNNQSVDVKVLELAGDYASNNPQANSTFADIKTPDGTIINKYVILDDPRFPFVFTHKSVQVVSSVAGRVVNATTGAGVPQAHLDGEFRSADSWPDGQLTIPIDRLDVVDFNVNAPGYLPTHVTTDLRARGAVPLIVKLMPAPGNGLIYLGADSEERPPDWLSDSGQLSLGDALTQHGNALVPAYPLFSAFGQVDAWLAINKGTFEVYPQLTDGLYGSTSGGGGVTGFAAALMCAYNKAASSLDSWVTSQLSAAPIDPVVMNDAIAIERELAVFKDKLGPMGLAIDVSVGWATQSASSAAANGRSSGAGGGGAINCRVLARPVASWLAAVPRFPALPLVPLLAPLIPRWSDRKYKTGWIEILLQDSSGVRVPAEAYRVVDADGASFEGHLDDHGFARVEGVAEGSASVSFPQIDASEWSRSERQPSIDTNSPQSRQTDEVHV